jgi:long-chain fatty acid transport protein
MKKVSIATWLALAALHLHAGGFQVNLQGVQQTGMGHTGAGLAIDASAQLFNPGGLALARGGVVAGFMPIFGRVSYLESAPGTYTASNEPTMSTPFAAYGAGRFRLGNDHRLAVGLAVYTPFGSRLLYDDDWKGQFALREISVKAIYKQLTVGYSYQDRYGIGASFIHANGNVSLRRAIPAQFADGSYGEVRLDGAGSGLGFTVGGFAKVSDRFSIGLNYRSKVVFQADAGQAEFTVPDALAESFPNTTFSASLPLPSTTTLGLAYHYKSPDDVVCVDVNYVGWSAYKSLAFDFTDNTDRLLDSDSPRNYTNSLILRAGWQMRASELLLLRAGAQLDLSPVPDGYLTPETPDATKFGLSAGASFDLGQFRADAAFLWIEGQRRTGGSDELQFYGSYKARAFIPSIGVAWLFNDNRQAVETEHF